MRLVPVIIASAAIGIQTIASAIIAHAAKKLHDMVATIAQCASIATSAVLMIIAHAIIATSATDLRMIAIVNVVRIAIV
jgi:hypothetical protein